MNSFSFVRIFITIVFVAALFAALYRILKKAGIADVTEFIRGFQDGLKHATQKLDQTQNSHIWILAYESNLKKDSDVLVCEKCETSTFRRDLEKAGTCEG